MKELLFMLRVFFGAVLRAFFPAAFDEARKSLRDTAEDAKPRPELKARLHKRIRERWRGAAAAGVLAFACLAGSGCGTRVVFVPPGEPVRLREPIPKAKVWVMGADGVPVAAKCTLAPGWYVVGDPGEEKPDEPKPADTPPDTAPPLGIAVPPDIPPIPAWPATASP